MKVQVDVDHEAVLTMLTVEDILAWLTKMQPEMQCTAPERCAWCKTHDAWRAKLKEAVEAHDAFKSTSVTRMLRPAVTGKCGACGEPADSISARIGGPAALRCPKHRHLAP